MMDTDTLNALTLLSQRVSVLEANSAAVVNAANVATTAANQAQIIANANAVQNAVQLQALQEQALRNSQARQAAIAALYHPNYAPPPGWQHGQPYPLHG